MVERFCRYVRIDTQSAEHSDSYPSTAKQLELSRLLQQELRDLGLAEAELTEHGYVFATIPATTSREMPVLGLIAHVDTSPEVSGADVHLVRHRCYQGGEIRLPGEGSLLISPEDNPALADCLGHDILTSDGTTLLGADNKAGVTEIMTAVDFLVRHPEIAHGAIRVAFTVDEEVGAGTKYFDIDRFGADYAYTIDGGTAGEIEDETFCADSLTITLRGVNMHPGYAKGRMLNSQRVAAELVELLPKETMSPETTAGREGYIHLHAIGGTVEETVLSFLIRDFTVEGLRQKEGMLRAFVEVLALKHPRLEYDFKIEESYRNMKFVLDHHPQVTAYAAEAIERAGLVPRQGLVRGGTDGARLTAMGLPTPNIFTGGHNFHSKTEWISVQDMVKAVETIIHLVMIWEERSGS